MPLATEHWVLHRTPVGVPQPTDFRVEVVELPDPEAGQVVVANRFISVDAGVRDRLSRDSYAPRAEPGEVIDGFAVGEVVASRNEKFRVGELVTAGTGWRRHYLSNGRGVMTLDPDLFAPPIGPSAAIGVMGVSGLTAYFGLRDVANLQPGETVLVSSAAGTVGATAGQIARILGCRVVGIAGGAARCQYVVEQLGFDECLDRYEIADLAKAVADACLDGIDVYFDNVGGEMLDAALLSMKRDGRIAVAGQVSEYNREEPIGARHLREVVERRLRLQGFVVWDFLAGFRGGMAEIAGWIREGRLTYHEHIVDGFENAPQLFCSLFTGSALGRSLIRL
jgi:NADPH-dependent curcumin reductase CurA